MTRANRMNPSRGAADPDSGPASGSAQPADAPPAEVRPRRRVDVAALAAEALEVDRVVAEVVDAWDAADGVGTDLGVEIAEVGRRVARLLAEVSVVTADPTERDELTSDGMGLFMCVEYYDDLDEHDTNACIDIVDRLFPVTAAALRVLRAVMPVPSGPAAG